MFIHFSTFGQADSTLQMLAFPSCIIGCSDCVFGHVVTLVKIILDKLPALFKLLFPFDFLFISLLSQMFLFSLEPLF